MKSQALLRQAENRCFGAIFLFLFAPLIAGIALAIRLDSPGPIFSRQSQRISDRQSINIFKFRTIRQAPLRCAHTDLVERSELSTRVGQFLIKSSLDELPLLLNMLRGEMCLVGRRPYAGILYVEAGSTADHGR